MDDPKEGGEKATTPAPKSETVLREEGILAFWKQDKTFQKSLEKHAPKGEFVFYDGPPFATGLPHSGSLLSSIIKDVVPRYKTMRGYRVPRVWGWDTHGLPIESLVEKKLGLKTKKDILAVGIGTFNEAARSMVLEYVDEWEKYVDRVGRWVDFKNSYKTMDNSYIESVWWALKRLDGKKLLYEGRKVLMYCPHCETPLAKAEIAMDNTYKDITEEAVTARFKVKDPHKHNLPDNTYLLAWTTTPWTLPGNVGLAVGPALQYAVVQDGSLHYIEQEDGGDLKGSDLVGIEYEPLFDVPALQGKNSYKVWAADFVTAGEGTGIVHTAVMYGEDDFALGQKERLPMVQMLTPDGHYNDTVPEFIRGKYIKQAEKFIKEYLETHHLLHAREMHTHSYPHCYRCGTALIYNAVASWFLNIQKVKAKMLSENEKVTWFPEHLKHGRFRNIVESAPDWTISRNRFWASPLPIWKEKGGDKLMVVGSLDELLSKTKKSGNRYFAMRHGEAKSNVTGVLDKTGDPDNHLTDRGRNQAVHAAAELVKEKIDLIIASPFVRTHETAKIVLKELALPDSALMLDERLHEYNDHSLMDVRKRVGEFLFEVERRYSGKNILIVSHGNPLWTLAEVAARKPFGAFESSAMPGLAEVRQLPFVPYPHRSDYELDLHRPYIDEVVLTDGKGGKYERIPEVLDCWVESGAMPFASMQYPRDKSRVNPGRFFGLAPKGYPGDFIAEYIAQTRTWFYYMHAMGIMLFGRQAFKSVVSTGNVLASDGTKLSKSKGNYTDPYELMNAWGADALRFYLMGSVVMQGEDMVFRDADIREMHNRVVGTLWNSFKFFELYKDQLADSASQSTHPLDRWVMSLLNKTVAEVTAALDGYDMPRAARALRSFIDTYSVWYVRRSRARARAEGADQQATLSTQRHVLSTLAKLIAPIMPFLAEGIYKGLGEKESVHLAAWPDAGAVDEALLADMQAIRELASKGLELRERATIKVRQPLSKFSAKAVPADAGLRQILAEELNVKEIEEDAALDEPYLATELTPELKEEGLVRDLVRRIQEWRKEQNLTVADRPAYELKATEEEKRAAQNNKEKIMAVTNLSKLTIVDA
jgi:isoleucyl-tRNA synthetase